MHIVNQIKSNQTKHELTTIFSCKPTEIGDLSDSFVSGEEDNGGFIIANKNINNEINGNWVASSSNSIHEARLKAKAKRRLRKNSSRDSGRGDSLSDNGDVVRGTSVAPTSPKSKLLDRKSRLGKGRGLPKKGKSILLNEERSTVVTKARSLSKACECLSKSHLYFRFPDFKGKVLHPHIHVVLSSILVVVVVVVVFILWKP